MQRSPKACSPTDRRIEYLAKAKLDRTQKMSDRKRLGGGSIIRGGTVPGKTLAGANDWASNSSITNLRHASNDSAFKKRNMTFDAGRDSKIDRKLMAASPGRNPILRMDQSPIEIMKQIPGNNGKNDSDFTNCLLAGSNSTS